MRTIEVAAKPTEMATEIRKLEVDGEEEEEEEKGGGAWLVKGVGSILLLMSRITGGDRRDRSKRLRK